MYYLPTIIIWYINSIYYYVMKTYYIEWKHELNKQFVFYNTRKPHKRQYLIMKVYRFQDWID